MTRTCHFPARPDCTPARPERMTGPSSQPRDGLECGCGRRKVVHSDGAIRPRERDELGRPAVAAMMARATAQPHGRPLAGTLGGATPARARRIELQARHDLADDPATRSDRAGDQPHELRRLASACPEWERAVPPSRPLNAAREANRHRRDAPAAVRSVLCALLGVLSSAAWAGRDLVAMDTGFRVSGMTEAEQLDLVRRLGFSGVTWSATEPAELRKVGELAEGIGLRLVAVYATARLGRQGLAPDPRVEGMLPAMRGLCPRLWLAIQSSEFPRSAEAGDEPAVEGLRQLADQAAAAGVAISLYHHAGFWLERIEDAVRLAKRVGRRNVVVTFNLAHWLKVDGRDLAQRLDLALPLLDAVTVNGATPDSDRSWGRIIQPLDQGTFDWAGLVRELDRRGFSGPVCLQLWGVGGLKQDNLRNSIAAWRAAFP